MFSSAKLAVITKRENVPDIKTEHCQKFGSKWRTRVRIQSLMAAKSCKEMYGIASKIQQQRVRIFPSSESKFVE